MTGFITPKTRYEAPGLGDTDETDPYRAADILLTRRVAAVVQRDFPGHAWLIEVSHKQGVVMISIPLFMGRHKWVIHIASLKTDPMMKTVMRACGEILERYRIPRQAFSLDNFLTALNSVPVHARAHHGKLAE